MYPSVSPYEIRCGNSKLRALAITWESCTLLCERNFPNTSVITTGLAAEGPCAFHKSHISTRRISLIQILYSNTMLIVLFFILSVCFLLLSCFGSCLSSSLGSRHVSCKVVCGRLTARPFTSTFYLELCFFFLPQSNSPFLLLSPCVTYTYTCLTPHRAT